MTTDRTTFTILVVEDDPDIRDLALKILRARGYAPLWAGDGAQALEMARGARPALILMDLSIPEIDGWEAARRLKADPETASIPIVAATAHAMSGDREKALAAGCDEYLSKPYRPDELRHLVARLLPSQ